MNRFTPIVRLIALSAAAVTSLLASPLSHAAGNAFTPAIPAIPSPPTRPAPQPAAIAADVQSAWDDMASSLGAAANSEAANRLRNARDKLKDYQWRTVYELVQVSKDPMPGTRLALQAMPAMSQLDAENYLNSLPSVQKVGGIPPLNCPVATLGGAAGRNNTGTVPGTSMHITVSDSQIQAAMLKASPTQGEAAFQAYMNLQTSTCAASYTTAQLTFRTKKFSCRAS